MGGLINWNKFVKGRRPRQIKRGRESEGRGAPLGSVVADKAWLP